MSYDEYVRRQAQQNLTNNPYTQKLESHQADAHTRDRYNAELDRLRREEDERRRQQ